MEDKVLTCRDCAVEFVFSAGEQQFFEERQFAPPTRCRDCRSKRKAAKAAKGGDQ